MLETRLRILTESFSLLIFKYLQALVSGLGNISIIYGHCETRLDWILSQNLDVVLVLMAALQ